MGEKATLTLYRIDRCGYYERSEKLPTKCGVECAFGDLARWINGMDIRDTCPYEVDSEDESTKTLCLGLERGKDTTTGFLLTLWSQASALASHIGYVIGSSKVGKPAITTSAINEGEIPGIPHYFWILPRDRIVVTVKFPGRAAGKTHLDRFMKGLLTGWTPHLVRQGNKPGERTVSIVGDDEQEIEGIYASFKSAYLPNPKVIDFIVKNRSRIRRLTYRHSLRATSDKPQRRLAKSALEFFGVTRKESVEDAVLLRYDVAYRPTKEELDIIIKEVQSGDGDFHNAGFQLAEDPRVYWLRDMLIRIQVDVDARHQDGVYQAASLLSWLEANQRTQIDALLNNK